MDVVMKQIITLIFLLAVTVPVVADYQTGVDVSPAYNIFGFKTNQTRKE